MTSEVVVVIRAATTIVMVIVMIIVITVAATQLPAVEEGTQTGAVVGMEGRLQMVEVLLTSLLQSQQHPHQLALSEAGIMMQLATTIIMLLLMLLRVEVRTILSTSTITSNISTTVDMIAPIVEGKSMMVEGQVVVAVVIVVVVVAAVELTC